MKTQVAVGETDDPEFIAVLNSLVQGLISNHEPIELIDVRSKNEFAAAHIPGARSIPFGELAAPKIYRKLRPTKQIICIISDGGHVQASLATGILRSAGCLNTFPLRDSLIS